MAGELDQELFDIYLTEILAPALAELPGVDFKKTSLQLREAVARYLRFRQGASINTIARHLDVTPRWVSKVTNGGPPEEPEVSWFMAVMDVLADAWPEALTAEQVRRHLLRQKRRTSLQAVTSHLDLYCELEKLQRRGDAYRAFGPTPIRVGSDGEASTAKVRGRVRCLRTICESYSRGDRGATFGALQGEMDEESLEEMAAEMQEAIGEIWQRHVAKSGVKELSGTANLVRYEGLVLLGRHRGGGSQGDR